MSNKEMLELAEQILRSPDTTAEERDELRRASSALRLDISDAGKLSRLIDERATEIRYPNPNRASATENTTTEITWQAREGCPEDCSYCRDEQIAGLIHPKDTTTDE